VLFRQNLIREKEIQLSLNEGSFKYVDVRNYAELYSFCERYVLPQKSLKKLAKKAGEGHLHRLL